MFRNTYQKGLLSIFYSIGSSPLAIWKSTVKLKFVLCSSHVFNLIQKTITGREWPCETTYWRRYKIGSSRDNGRKCSNYLHHHTDRAASITCNKATFSGADREEYGKAFLVWSSGMYTLCLYIGVDDQTCTYKEYMHIHR